MPIRALTDFPHPAHVPRGSDAKPLSLADVLEQEYAHIRQLRRETGTAEGPETPHTPAAKEDTNEASRLSQLRAEIHRWDEPLTALCLSGGGIRSATFS